MLSLEKLFSSPEYSDEGFDRPRWWSEGSFYTTLRKVDAGSIASARADLTSTTASDSAAQNTNVHEVIWHDAKTGESSTLVSYAQLIPPGKDVPLTIDDYVTSKDRSKILIFTNSEKVWRLKTRGSYWILDFNATKPENFLFQLGGPDSSTKLMFAAFSPDASKVAYVKEHNIYVEDVFNRAITPITSDGSATIINGTFDWVYEEEFSLRNGFRYVAHIMRFF